MVSLNLRPAKSRDVPHGVGLCLDNSRNHNSAGSNCDPQHHSPLGSATLPGARNLREVARSNP
jgi:hypothetical protein